MTRHVFSKWAGRVPALNATLAAGCSERQPTNVSASIKYARPRNRVLWICLALLAMLGCTLRDAGAQSPNFAIQGPTIAIRSCAGVCASIAYPAGSQITQNRVVVVPRGNIQFQFPVYSTMSPPSSIADLQLRYKVTVTATGPNPGETASNSAGTVLTGVGSSTLVVPLNVEWSESIVTFQIDLIKSYNGVACNAKLGCKVVTYSWGDNTTGPSLSSVPLGLSYSQAFTQDAFLVVVTPAAAYQLPVLPVAILYSPLGNAGGAKSTLAFTTTEGENQQATTSTGGTVAYTQDDKTTYQAGVTLDMASGGESGGNGTKVTAGFNFSGSWDNSVESDTQSLSTNTTLVTEQEINSISLPNSPAPGQPAVNQITYSTQPFWNDQILAVASAQFALWDYPDGPVVQPLGNVGVIELPIRTLDNCIRTPNAVEPSSLTPVTWEPGRTYTVGTFVIGNDIIGNPAGGRQVVTTAGTTGSAAPNWNATFGATTSDGTLVWTNESSHVLPKPTPPPATTPEYLWLDSQECTNIANLDQFYLKKAQSAYPLSYNTGFSTADSLDPGPTVTNTQSYATTVTQATSSQLTSKTSSAGSNSEGVTGAISNFLGQIGINLSLGTTSTSTTTYTAVSGTSGQSQKSVGGSAAESTTVDDTYTGQMGYNIVQDLIFDGMAVEVPGMNPLPPLPLPIRLPFSKTESDAATTLFPSGASEQVDYTVLQPSSELDPGNWAGAHDAAAQKHADKPVPDAAPGYAVPGNVQ